MEQKAAHAPGPWVVESFIDSYEAVAEESLVTIAAVRRFSGREDANARLIAAAPELLAACKSMIEWDDREHEHPQRQAAYRNARAAIAKAEGGAA